MRRHIPTIKAAMSPFPFSIETSSPLSQAETMMKEHGIRHIPVTEGHLPVGIITDRDISVAGVLGRHQVLGKSEAIGSEALAERSGKVVVPEVTVGMVCSRDPYSVDHHTPASIVARTLAERHLDYAIVLKEGRLAGIFTSTDACRFLAEHLEEVYGPTTPEEPEAA